MTTRPNKAAIKSILEEYAQLETRRIGVEQKRDRELAPHKAAYEKKAGPIEAAATQRLESIRKQQQVLSEQIKAQLLAGVDAETGTITLSQVVVEVETTKMIATAVAAREQATSIAIGDNGSPILRAVAQVDTSPGNRHIDPQAFFESVKPARRTSKFWSCVKVLMGEADKYLGKVKADELAGSTKSYSVSISLKP